MFIFFIIITDIVLNLILIRFIMVTKIIDSFFKVKTSQNIESCTIEESSTHNVAISTYSKQPPIKIPKVEFEKSN